MDEIPGMRAGIGDFFIAAETVARGMVFFVDAAKPGDVERFEIVSDPKPIGTGTYLATVEQLSGAYTGKRLSVQLRTGRRVN